MLAACFCIRNRIRAGWHGGDWALLLSHHRDYAASNVAPQFDLPDTRDQSFSQLLQQIDDIFSGRREDDITISNPALMGPITSFDGEPKKPVALYYGRLDDPNLRPWFLENISRNLENHRQVATVGSLTFFS